MSLELHVQMYKLFVNLSVSLDEDYSFPPSELDFGLALSPHPSIPFSLSPIFSAAAAVCVVCVCVYLGEIINY